MLPSTSGLASGAAGPGPGAALLGDDTVAAGVSPRSGFARVPVMGTPLGGGVPAQEVGSSPASPTRTGPVECPTYREPRIVVPQMVTPAAAVARTRPCTVELMRINVAPRGTVRLPPMEAPFAQVVPVAGTMALV